MNQFFTHLRSWTSILNMGLPVEEIMAEVEEELMNMEEEELDHMEGEVHENGEELNEDKEKDLDGIKLEAQDGWLWTLSTFATSNKCSKTMMFGDVRTSVITNAPSR